MKEKLLKIWKKLEPVHGVIYFVVILACAHFFWKFTVIGDESNKVVTFLGLNISAPFIALSKHIAYATAYILQNWLDIPLYLQGTSIHFLNGKTMSVVWSCSGLKQMYIFFCIIAFYRGSWKQKLWYIPAGLIVIHLFNIFRITSLGYVVYAHSSHFDLFHTHIFKYLFYGLIFLMWVLWEEKFAKKIRKTNKDTNEIENKTE